MVVEANASIITAPGVYNDVSAVVDAAERAGLSRAVARLEPVICVDG